MPIQNCSELGCFLDADGDDPVQITGEIKFPGLRPLAISFDSSDNFIRTIETCADRLIGLSGALSLTVMDSKGFQVTYENKTVVIVVKSVRLWHQTL